MHGRPIIGVTTMSDHDAAGLHAPRFSINQSYNKAVMGAGGIPVMIPQVEDEDDLHAIYSTLDGLLLPGGVDIHPRFYGEEPHPELDPTDHGMDFIESNLLKWALEDDMPVFGICRGHQVLNVLLGGTLWQDIPSQYATVFDHRESYKRKIRDYPAHDVRVAPNSKLHELVGADRIWVNTSHHQAIRKVAPGLRAVAWAPDDIVEGLESTNHSFVVTVQWHPEEMVRKHEWARRLFAAHVEAAMARKHGQGKRELVAVGSGIAA